MTTINSSKVNDIIYLAPFDASVKILPHLRHIPSSGVGNSTPIADSPRYHGFAFAARSSDRERTEIHSRRLS